MTTENVPEMGRYLRQIVDNAFEEGHFESAVAMLDQLRSPDHKPSIIHILHLIFIALHPIQESQLNEEEAHLDPKALLMQSPRKMIKHSKASLTLSASAVIAAQQLLMSLVATNSPQYIGTALPCYPETKNEPPMEFPFSESLIFNQAVAIKHSKNCWEILKSSFKARTTHLLTPKANGKGKQASRLRFVEPSYNDLNDMGEIKIVSDDSWFILEWLIALFEKDADTSEEQGQQRYSPLLLNQLPPPPIDSSARWDASEPLRIISHAFQQSDTRRQRSGMRLLTLLVELTQTPYLNLPSFATSVLAQLTTISSETSSQFDSLFSHLTSAPAALSFKLALCKKIIEDASDASSSSNSNRRVSVGRASGGTARSTTTSAKPRARVRTTTAEGSVNPPERTAASSNDPSALDTAANGSSQNANTPLSVSPTYIARLPSYSEVVQILRTSLPFFTFSYPQQQPDSVHLPNKSWATFLLLTRVKFELLLAYILAQLHRRELAEQNASLAGQNEDQVNLDPPDAAFAQSVSDGSFIALLHDIFAPRGGNEDEQMILFKDVLSALTGLSLIEESSTNMVLA